MRSHLSPFGFPAECWSTSSGHHYYSEPPTPFLVTGAVEPWGDDERRAQAWSCGHTILDEIFPTPAAAKSAVEEAAREAKGGWKQES